MSKGFSLLEVIFAISLILIVVLLTLPAFTSLEYQRKALSEKEVYRREALNLMENTMAYREVSSDQFTVTVYTLDNGLEKVEVEDSETGQIILSSYRPPKGFYAY